MEEVMNFNEYRNKCRVTTSLEALDALAKEFIPENQADGILALLEFNRQEVFISMMP